MMSGSANIELFIYGEANKVLILNNIIWFSICAWDFRELTCLVFWARWILKCPPFSLGSVNFAPNMAKQRVSDNFLGTVIKLCISLLLQPMKRFQTLGHRWTFKRIVLKIYGKCLNYWVKVSI